MLPPLVQALLDPKAYPQRPRHIELVQTQISFVFLSGEHAYKVKKPVDFGFLDFTTLEKRRFFCGQEVVLNRRLCPDVYLGVVPIAKGKGGIAVEGEGEVIEYAVKMRQLPGERMLDQLLEKDQVSPEMVERVAYRLAEFHWGAETGEEIASYGDPGIVLGNAQENFSQTEKYIDLTLSGDTYQRLKEYTYSFLKGKAAFFEARRKAGRIRDCHGDVHAAHVCFADGLYIFDCIEFNDRFRYSDVANEIAFLAMDLDHHGRRDLSRRFVAAYGEASRDGGFLEMLPFYKAYRAYVRGKVESFKLDDPHISEEEKERVLWEARMYFHLASSYAAPLRPTLFITTGLIGTGKSALAQALAKGLGLVVLSSDVTRKRLAHLSPREHRFEGYEGGIYSRGFSSKTYERMFQEAEGPLGEGESVILDASFRRAEERAGALRLAQRAKAAFLAIECRADEETIKGRLGRRFTEEETVSDGRLEIFEDLKRDFEPPTELAPAHHLVVDTSGLVGGAAEKVFAWLKRPL